MSTSFSKVTAYITPVKSFTDTPEEKGILHSVSSFDERGNMIHSVTYQDGKTKKETSECAYNSDNALIEETVTHHLDGFTQKRIIEINKNEGTTTERTVYTDGSESKSEIRYSRTGKPLQTIHYYDDVSIESQDEYTYDDQDRLTVHIIKDGDGAIISEDTIAYTDHTREIIHAEDGSETGEVQHLNDSGLPVRIERYEGDTVYQEETNDFDSAGRLVASKLSEMGVPVRERVIEYDAAGNIVIEQLNDLRYRRTEKVARTFDNANRLLTESRYSTFGSGESYRLMFEYE